MAASRDQSTVSLFNDFRFSDVSLRQISADGSAREYHAHKAILFTNSKWFQNVFITSFKEPTLEALELHDDHPAAFGDMMRLFYILDIEKFKYGEADFEKLKLGPLEVVQLYTVATKYDCKRLRDFAVATVRAWDISPQCTEETTRTYAAMVEAHYSRCVQEECPMGNAIVELIQRTDFLTTRQSLGLVNRHLPLARDIFRWGWKRNSQVFASPEVKRAVSEAL